MSAPQPWVNSRLSREGTATSSSRWPKKVALARISRSRTDVDDWSGIAASFSSRCSRHGEWMSSRGMAKTSRRGSVLSQRTRPAPAPSGRRPMTWSQCSIAWSSGARCSGVHGSMAVVTSTRGNRAQARPISRAPFSPRPAGETIRVSTIRPASARCFSSGSMTALASSVGASVSRMTRMPASGSGSRWKWRRNGSSESSIIGRQPFAVSRGTQDPATHSLRAGTSSKRQGIVYPPCPMNRSTSS